MTLRAPSSACVSYVCLCCDGVPAPHCRLRIRVYFSFVHSGLPMKEWGLFLLASPSLFGHVQYPIHPLIRSRTIDVSALPFRLVFEHLWLHHVANAPLLGSDDAHDFFCARENPRGAFEKCDDFPFSLSVYDSQSGPWNSQGSYRFCSTSCAHRVHVLSLSTI